MRKRRAVQTAIIDPSQLQLLAVPDVAQLLCVGRTTVYALINAREIETVMIRGARRVLIVSVWQYIERQKRAS